MEQPYGIIYLAINRVNGSFYIGQTTSTLSLRASKHKASAKYGNDCYFHAALRKYGFENFIFQEIDRADSRQELDYMEKFWINYHDAVNSDRGYNLKEGGISQGKLSEETKKKIGDAHRGTKRSPEARAKMSLAQKGRQPAFSLKELRKNRPDLFIGRPHSEESKKKISEAKKGSWRPGMGSIPISVKRKDTGEIFRSLGHAAKSIGFCQPTFSHAFKKSNLPIIGGIQWERI